MTNILSRTDNFHSAVGDLNKILITRLLRTKVEKPDIQLPQESLKQSLK